MFSKKVEDENKIMEEEWEKQYSIMMDKLKAINRSGIELKPSYTPTDIKGMDYKDIALPGQYPFTRGNYPFHYQVMPLMMMHGYGFGTAEETLMRREWLSRLGSRLKVGTEDDLTVCIFTMDLPTQRGYDPDEPGARGRVGDCGMSLSTIKDMEAIFEGLPLEKVLTTFIGFDASMILVALYAAYCKYIRKEPLDKLYMLCCNLFHHQWFWDSAAFPPETAMKLETEFVKFIVETCPMSYPGVVDGYNVAEAGATPVQEAAFSIVAAVSLMEECVKAGLDPDKVASRFIGHPHISLNFFEEIAKLRAMRKVWAKILKERFGCKRPESLQLKFLDAQTAGFDLTAQEPLNNIIRTTIMALAGMLADVEGMWVSSYDEALGIPTEEAVQVAVRTYQILHEETDIPHVTDPLGGSYYIEWLTTRMEEEIMGLMKKMEDLGGYMKCWQTGWIRQQVEKSANERLKKLNEGKEAKIGVNKYRIEEVPKMTAFRVPPEVELKAIERVKKYRQGRDNSRVESALAKVKEAAIAIDRDWPRSCGVLMPALIEAARCEATAGEMHCILRDIFGFGYYSG